jgi:hypothetical protein
VQLVSLPAAAQAPLQPLKELPEAGAALSVTVLPVVKRAEQAVPQEIPAGVDLTLPSPLTFTLSVWVLGGGVVVTAVAPPQPSNPRASTATRQTHPRRQSIEDSERVIVVNGVFIR